MPFSRWVNFLWVFWWIGECSQWNLWCLHQNNGKCPYFSLFQASLWKYLQKLCGDSGEIQQIHRILGKLQISVGSGVSVLEWSVYKHYRAVVDCQFSELDIFEEISLTSKTKTKGVLLSLDRMVWKYNLRIIPAPTSTIGQPPSVQGTGSHLLAVTVAGPRVHPLRIELGGRMPLYLLVNTW